MLPYRLDYILFHFWNFPISALPYAFASRWTLLLKVLAADSPIRISQQLEELFDIHYCIKEHFYIPKVNAAFVFPLLPKLSWASSCVINSNFVTLYTFNIQLCTFFLSYMQFRLYLLTRTLVLILLILLLNH